VARRVGDREKRGLVMSALGISFGNSAKTRALGPLRLAALVAIAAAAFIAANTPPALCVQLQPGDPGWPQTVGDWAWSSPALGDLDGDGDLEVVAGSYDRKVHAWHHDGAPVWAEPLSTGGQVESSPALGDLDGDGDLEIVVGSHDGKVYAWHHDGTPVWSPPPSTGGWIDGSPALGDLDGDGNLEVVVGSWDMKVYAWHHDGTPVWSQPLDTGGLVVSSPALGDLDADGDLEVVVGSYDTKVYAWHHDGTPLWAEPRSTGGVIESSPALGDLDGDGMLEIVVGSYDGKVYAWRCDGTALWTEPLATTDLIRSSPALGDLDRDGDLEVVVASYDNSLYAWHHDGTPVWAEPLSTGDHIESSPALGDLDGDGYLEIVIGSDDTRVYAWDHTGAPVWAEPLTTAGRIQSSPALGDLDGDGDLEVVVGSAHQVYAWTCDLPTGDRLPWPMFGHDRLRTGRSQVADFVASPRSGRPPLTVTFTDLTTGSPAAWQWDFGDGAASDEQNPTHVYATPGTYTVALTATSAGVSDTAIKSQYIVATLEAVSADFTATPTSGTAPLTVRFTAVTTGSPTLWEWDFGDGSTCTEHNPAHQYAKAGRHTVSLTVANADAADTETKTKYVLVNFIDVPEDRWAYDEIMACVDATIVSGYDDYCYHPEYAVARDQMAVYISRSICTPTGEAGLADYTPPATPSFSDVATDYWAYTYIEYAVAANIVTGYGDQTYRPEYVLDRGQMAVFIARAIVDPLGEEGLVSYLPPGTPTFPDVPNTGYGDDGADPFWAYTHIEYIAAESVCGGYGDGLYHPEYVCSRDQMAVYIARAFNLPI
jgi:PKD repeat protein